MHIYALVGQSGTGKSHHAIFATQEYHIDMIIDDGLLIKGSYILAGTSAKRSPTKIGAIKTALFTEDNHAQELKDIINKHKPSSILILGTSVGMVKKIAQRLELPCPETIINIEDIASRKSIIKAQQIRSKYGTHVVPAPSVEVKQKFSGSITDPLRSLFRRKTPHNKTLVPKSLWVDQTVVRPAFNYLGKFLIADNVITEIVKHVGTSLTGVDRILKVNTETTDKGLILHIDTCLVYGYFIPDTMAALQKSIKKTVEYMTSLNIISVDIHAVKLVI
ncbi:MAG: Asp23/Gls24 family envelope stress response protein [Bacillota bacterium]|jgi:uncharacterized alkaline shock family protein YloU